MGRLKRFIAQVLGLEGWEATDTYWELPDGLRFQPLGNRFLLRRDARLVVVVRRRGGGRCGHCEQRCRRVHEQTPTRRWRDLPWAEHAVFVEYAPQRLACRKCREAAVEFLPWADRYQRETRRLQQTIALQAQSMPVLHVAAQHGLDWHAVRRAERHALERWLVTRPPSPLRMVGIDEKYLGRRRSGDKYVTIVSNLETGEPIWIGWGRRQSTVEAWLATQSAEDKAGIVLFATDMHQPFIEAIRADQGLRHAAHAHDPFHVIKRANAALDELRRETFFRGGADLRALGRGKRWLYLRSWEHCTPEQEQQLKGFLALNGKLARARQVVDELRGVLGAADRQSMSVGLNHVLRRIAKRANVPMRKLHDSLANHYLGIVVLGEHHPPTGRTEALNNNWETQVRKARGYRDLDYLMLKLRFAAVHPLRTGHDVERFLALGLPAPQRRAA